MFQSLLSLRLFHDDELRMQWSVPAFVLPILFLLGGDVVEASLAQLAGSHQIFTPVVFSFGWVAYSVSALLSAVGENRLMPRSPDYPCLVINGKSGYARDNRSWIISRILRDFDYWKDEQVEIEEQKLKEVMKQKSAAKDKRDQDAEPRVPLSVSIYNVSDRKRAGSADYDSIDYFSVFIVALQLGLAAIPCVLYNDRSVLMVTGAGTLLAWCTAALPQWHEEKVGACRNKSNKTFAITSGNGTKNVLVIRGCKQGLDLEDLAAATAHTAVHTRIALCVLAILWFALLITVAGLNDNTSFLLGILGIGLLQNIWVAASPRRPGAYGIHLGFERTICKEKVMPTLQALEDIQPFLGRSLLSTYFPGELREDEAKWWEAAKARAKSSLSSTG